MRTGQRVARGVWLLGAVIVLVHGCVTILGIGGEPAWATNGWPPVVVFALCAAASGARIPGTGKQAPAWAMLTAGLAFYAGGQVLRTVGVSDGATLLSLATLFWLVLGPAAFAVLILRVRAEGVPVRRDLWLDGVIGGLTVAALGTMLIFELVVHPHDGAHGGPAALAFALSDLLVVGFGVGVAALYGWRPPRSIVVLIVGFAVLCIQDTLYLAATLRDAYPPVLDTAWMAAMLAVAAAPAWTRPAEPRPRRVRQRAVIALPLTFGTISVIQATGMGLVGHASTLCLLLTGMALLAVVARCALTFRAHVETIDALERAEAHLAQAQRHAQVGSWEWDAVTGTLTWSAEMARLHGWHGSGAPPVDVAMALIDRDDRRMVIDAFQSSWESGEPLSLEYRVPGEGRVLLCRGVASRSGGETDNLFGTCEDVTDRYARTEAERANQAKSEFLSRMSHELRTPLNAILGFGQLLGTGDLADRQRGNVDHILGAGRHLLDLVNEVLDISRIEAGELSLSLEPVEIAPVVREAVDLLRPLADERRVAIAVDVESADRWVQADQQRLKQVVLNLLSNAIKYNRDGGRIDVRIDATDGGRVRLAITDTGPGIPDELLPRLFMPFERLGAERSGIEGTGLGLSLSRGLAQAMGATLTVATEVGKGSTFTLVLDAAHPAVLRTADVPAEPAGPCAGLHQEHTVLCIEDNVSNLTLIEEVFVSRPGVRLLTAVQGSMGIEIVRQHRPDLVLLDLNLPDMDGAEVLDRLRGDSATSRIPVVVVSADATRRQVERLLGAGASAYVTKPIDVPDLLAVVDDALGIADPASA